MPKPKKEEPTYTPADICKQFDLPRTTLFRWEENGEILAPDRNEKGERIYRRKHLQSLCKRIRRKVEDDVATLYNHHGDAEFDPSRFLEPIHLIEFELSNGSMYDLQRLHATALAHSLSLKTINTLIKQALERSPGDPIRTRIWEILIDSDKVAKNKQ